MPDSDHYQGDTQHNIAINRKAFNLLENFEASEFLLLWDSKQDHPVILSLRSQNFERIYLKTLVDLIQVKKSFFPI